MVLALLRASFISAEEDSSPIVNSKYIQYGRQDQAILAWLLASMTAGILTQMVGLETSNQVWEKLQTHYASQTRAQIKKHKQQLCTPKKDRSITAYLLDIKKTVDQLVAVGCPISTEDHIEVVLDGLSDEYDPFITPVITRLDPYTVADIEALLLAQENRIERNKQSVDQILQASVASVPHSFSHYNSSSTNYPSSFHPTAPAKQRFYSKPRFTPSKNFPKMPSNSSSTRVHCQICGKYGHTALHCWHRFDSSTQSQVTANTAHFSTSLGDDEPSILGTPNTLHDPLWYPDSGASHHLTANSKNLSTTTPYTGSEEVVVGNGFQRPITSIGSASFTDLNTHNTFSLQHFLHVPTISKNLLSVSRFASDNHVYFEFHADVCLVKRQGTNKILLQGKLKDGLYMFPNLVQTAPYSAHNTAITTGSSAYHMRHSRFGHAQPRVIHQIMKICNIPFTVKREFCESCVVGKSHQLPFNASQTIYFKPLQLVFIDI